MIVLFYFPAVLFRIAPDPIHFLGPKTVGGALFAARRGAFPKVSVSWSKIGMLQSGHITVPQTN